MPNWRLRRLWLLMMGFRQFWWDLDAKLEFKQFPEVAVPLPLKSSEQNSGVFMIHGLKLFEFPKNPSYVAISDFIIVVYS